MSTLKTIIFSDLDGTLLDHYSYQSSAAHKTLAQLRLAQIPVILNTSKTRAEIAVIQQELKLDTPFIVENGAAIYIPTNTFKNQPSNTLTVGDFWVKAFSSPREHWLNFLSKHAKPFASQYRGFSMLSDADLCEITGLDLTSALRAKQRQYGEPLHWLGDESSKKAFIEHLVNLGANVTQGGRFIHIGDYCDKGQALIWLTERYREEFNNNAISTIALGDGNNDSTMLEAADIAVQVRSPVHEFPHLYRQYKTTKTQRYGPEGWADAIQELLVKQLATFSINAEVTHG